MVLSMTFSKYFVFCSIPQNVTSGVQKCYSHSTVKMVAPR